MSLPVPLSATGGRVLQAIIDAPSDTLIATDFDGTLARADQGNHTVPVKRQSNDRGEIVGCLGDGRRR